MVHRFRIPTLLALAVALIALGIVFSGGAADAAGSSRTDVIIGFKGQPGPAERALVQQAGGTIKYTYHLVPAIAASVPEAAIAGLQANPNVTAVDLDGEVHAIDAELNNTWGVKHIGAGAVHASGNKGKGVKVAVIDSGIDYNHPDLNANFAGGHDFVNNDTDPMDDRGHGTHVAGTIAAEDDDAGVVGVAPEASLYGLKVLNSSGSGSWSDVIAAVQWAADPFNGIQVTNNSYGSSVNPGGIVKAAFDNSAAAGVLHVASAGNSSPCGGGDDDQGGGKGNNVGYPARFESVIAVSATDQFDNRACFSSIGPAVELAAPGVAINSTKLGGGYVEFNGTSMASPHVAGTAALVIATGITDIADVRTQLQTTADDLGDPGLDSQYGYGLVNAAEAAAGPPPPPNDAPTVTITGPADGTSFNSGATILFEGTASDTEDDDATLTANLAWTSSIDGAIGIGGSVSTTLSDGNHTITASVTDSGGKTGSASISITVGTPPPEPTTVSVNSIDYAMRGPHLYITVALVDDFGNPVGGASVSITLSHELGSSWPGTGTSGEDGTVTWRLRKAPSGCYTTTVTDVTASGLIWDPNDPANVSDPFCK